MGLWLSLMSVKASARQSTNGPSWRCFFGLKNGTLAPMMCQAVFEKSMQIIWVFPKMGVPLNHPISIGFSIKKHPFWGIPIFGNTHILDDVDDISLRFNLFISLPLLFVSFVRQL